MTVTERNVFNPLGVKINQSHVSTKDYFFLFLRRGSIYLQIRRLVCIYSVNKVGLVLFANSVRFVLRVSVLVLFYHISLETLLLAPSEGVLLFP